MWGRRQPSTALWGTREDFPPPAATGQEEEGGPAAAEHPGQRVPRLSRATAAGARRPAGSLQVAGHDPGHRVKADRPFRSPA